MRHTTASQAITSGADVGVVQMMLGHERHHWATCGARRR
ncbi:hypothetical protein [Pseudonocardia sp. ICBG1142]